MNEEKYNKAIDRFFLALDIAMVVLAVANLILLAVQINFETDSVRNLLQKHLPLLYKTYLPVYDHFAYIDLCFVAVFVSELLLRWAVAVYNRSYARWFFYPFAHWYDVLGCIPLGSFRILRVIRIVAILIRLQRLGIIQIRNWYIYKVFSKYINILAEEVTDRVVINVLSGVQEEVKGGIPVTGKILREVVLPRKDVLVNFMAHRLQRITRDQYLKHTDELRNTIRVSVTKAIRQNPNIRTLEQIPLIGPAASEALQQSVYDITFQTIHQIFERMATDESRLIIERVTDAAIEAVLIPEEDKKLQQTFTDMVIHALELIKEEVAIRQWQKNSL
ncbi:MAG: ion transporter [Chitinophagales bacterium]|nr:ion transporter [Chitinophagales bacterium]MDW8417859.1 hypothetical protein [Chitinophagales bacterium]